MKKDNHEKLYDILLEMKEEMGEMKSDIKSTLAQTTKTNGRVSNLEIEVKKHQSFIDNLRGKVAVIVIVGTFVFNNIWQYLKAKIGI